MTVASYQVVVIELFGGLMPATAALRKLNLSTITYFSEIANDPLEIAAKHWPEAIPLGDIRFLTKDVLQGIVQQHTGALFWLTGGMPRMDDSSFDPSSKGIADECIGLCRLAADLLAFLQSISSNVAFTFECNRMEPNDRQTFSDAFKVKPIEINSRGFAPLSRPRWWWIGGKPLKWPLGTQKHIMKSGVTALRPKEDPAHWRECVLPGYIPCAVDEGQRVLFSCLTPRIAQDGPACQAEESNNVSQEALTRWAADHWSQAPHHFELTNMVADKRGKIRRLLPCEEEMLMGFPSNYTAYLATDNKKDVETMRNRRHTLLGKAWSLHVTLFIATALISPNVAEGGATGNSATFNTAPEAFRWGRDNCPYVQDILARNGVIPGALPPDWVEQNAHAASSLAEQVQARRHTSYHLDRAMLTSGPTASLPKGLPPDVHFYAGSEVQSPLDVIPETPDDMGFAIRKTLALGKAADAWRRKQLNLLVAWMKTAPALKEHWDRLHTGNARMVAPKVMPYKVDLVAHSIVWPDTTLAAMTAVGATPLGPQEKTGVFRDKVTSAQLSVDSFAAGCGAYMRKLVTRPPPRHDMMAKVYELTEAEIKAELLDGYFSFEEMNAKYGEGNWRALPRYPIQQGAKWRLIDNGKAGEHNSTYESTETIHTTSTAAGIAVAAHFRSLNGKPLAGKCRLQVSTQDMWKAYRQIPCHMSQCPFMAVMIFHPVRKEWVFGEARGLLFGLTGAVLNFNRVPAFITAVARRWLAIPVQHFFDDFRIFDILQSGGSANHFFRLLLSEVLGWRIDPGKEQIPASVIEFLGNNEYYHPVDIIEGACKDTVVLTAKKGRALAIDDSINTIKINRKLPCGDAKSLVGRVIHYATTCAGRVGKGILCHINDRAADNTPEWYQDLSFNLDFVQILTRMNIPRHISIVRERNVGVRFWTDASFSVDSDGLPDCKLCAIIRPRPPLLPQGIVLKVPPEIFKYFKERKQQIHMGELLAPICAMLKWPHLMMNESAIFYIDNMGVLCNIVNGASRAEDASTLIFALHLRLAKLNAKCWWEWVESESNCSDGGSRVGTLCPLAADLGIPLVEHAFPSIPANFQHMLPEAWESWWEVQQIP